MGKSPEPGPLNNNKLYCLYLKISVSFHMINIVYFQRYHMELACILIIFLSVNILHARFIAFYF
jgi:hypothetical protein